VGGSSHRKCFLEGRDITMKGAPDFPAVFKKQSEIKKKQVFSTESKEQH
jgi:hypothetical protein